MLKPLLWILEKDDKFVLAEADCPLDLPEIALNTLGQGTININMVVNPFTKEVLLRAFEKEKVYQIDHLSHLYNKEKFVVSLN
jgi:hypothetical protein